MYDELVKDLRYLAKVYSICNNENTKEYALAVKAADAIEEIQKDLEQSKNFEAFWQKEAEEALRNFQVAIAQKNQWIPVTERLPKKECKNYWCYTNAGEMCECRWTNSKYFGISDKWGWSIIDVPQYQHITHWMNLPEPPKEET